MANKGLIFIPDISGFTKFINELEISHSRLIIQELLEVIINSNNIGLEISEVEGDAVLFYKFGSSPGLGEIYSQVEKMFTEFHKQLIAYDHRKFCQCTACMSAINLSLKIISHYGEFAGYTVHNFNKLIGKDIIVAHQLLKNDIPRHEYWLVTSSLVTDTQPAGFASWMEWNKGAKQTETGEISYHYTQLSPLKNDLAPDVTPPLDLSYHVKAFSVTRDYNTDIIMLFHASGDFSNRSKWQEGVKAVEEIGHFLPRIGMRCKCVLDSGQEVIFSTSYSYSNDRIEFSESDENNNHVTYYTLEKTGENTSRLTIDYYIAKNQTKDTFDKKKLEESFTKSLLNLEKLIESGNFQ